SIVPPSFSCAPMMRLHPLNLSQTLPLQCLPMTSPPRLGSWTSGCKFSYNLLLPKVKKDPNPCLSGPRPLYTISSTRRPVLAPMQAHLHPPLSAHPPLFYHRPGLTIVD